MDDSSSRNIGILIKGEILNFKIFLRISNMNTVLYHFNPSWFPPTTPIPSSLPKFMIPLSLCVYAYIIYINMYIFLFALAHMCTCLGLTICDE